MKLHFRRLGEGKPMVILHGLFGSADNWQSLAKQLATQFEIFLVDQRNHGRSPHSEDFSYEVMAADVYEFVRDENLQDIILVGHSMGGKTAMTFAMQFPELIQKLIVVDMGVKQYPVHHQAILAGLAAIDLTTVTDRKVADETLANWVPDFSVRQFLLKNMYWEQPGRLGWRFNLATITREIEKMGVALADGTCNVVTLFISGGKSDYLEATDHESILQYFPNSKFEVISEAGHWIHAEAPEQFLHLLTKFASDSEA